MVREVSELLDSYQVLDARELAEKFPKGEYLDLTVTSPPYWNLKDYGTRKQIGFGQSYEAYLNDLQSVLTAVFQRTKKTGSLWVISDTLKLNGELCLLPFDITRRAREAGWRLQDIIIWQKDRTLPWSHQGKLRNIFEYIAFFSKSRSFKYDISQIRDVADLKNYWLKYPERYSPDGKAPTRTWQIPIPRQGSWGRLQNYVRHACPLPPALVERILHLSTEPGDVVFDPFAGSGSVLATASALGRHYIGVDLNRKYRAMFLEQVKPAIAKRYSDARSKATEHDPRLKFAEIIRALRALKFPKELVRLSRATKTPIECSGMFAIPGHNDGELLLALVYPDRSAVPENFHKAVLELCSKAPLSKYGVRPIVTAQTVRTAKQWLTRNGNGSSKSMFLYEHGRFYAPSGRHDSDHLIAAWKKNGIYSKRERRYPPIASPVTTDLNSNTSTHAMRGAK